MPDEELARTWRRNAYAKQHPFSAIIRQEMDTRLIAALKSFNTAAGRSGRPRRRTHLTFGQMVVGQDAHAGVVRAPGGPLRAPPWRGPQPAVYFLGMVYCATTCMPNIESTSASICSVARGGTSVESW